MSTARKVRTLTRFIDSFQKQYDSGVGTRIASSLNGENPGLDWAVIEIQPPTNEPANMVSIDWITGQCILCVERVVPAILEDANVLAVTSSGIQTGSLSASSVFLKSPYGVSFEEVWTVRLDRMLG